MTEKLLTGTLSLNTTNQPTPGISELQPRLSKKKKECGEGMMILTDWMSCSTLKRSSWDTAFEFVGPLLDLRWMLNSRPALSFWHQCFIRLLTALLTARLFLQAPMDGVRGEEMGRGTKKLSDNPQEHLCLLTSPVKPEQCKAIQNLSLINHFTKTRLKICSVLSCWHKKITYDSYDL